VRVRVRAPLQAQVSLLELAVQIYRNLRARQCLLRERFE
jgi:hypothetical protein